MMNFGGLLSVNIHSREWIALLGKQGPVYGISISARLYDKLRRAGYEVYLSNDDPKYDKMMREQAESLSKKNNPEPKINKAEEIIDKDLKAIEAAEAAQRLKELAEAEKNRQAAIELQNAFTSVEVDIDNGEEFELPEPIINEPEPEVVEEELAPVEDAEESVTPESEIELDIIEEIIPEYVTPVEESIEVEELSPAEDVEEVALVEEPVTSEPETDTVEEELAPVEDEKEISTDENVVNLEIEKALEGFVPLEEIHDIGVETSFMDDLEDNFKKQEEAAIKKIELAEAQLAKKLAKDLAKTEEDAHIEEALGEEEVYDLFDDIAIKPLPVRDGVHLTHRKTRIDFTVDDGIDRSGMKKFTKEELTVKSPYSREDLIDILHERGYKPGHMWYGRHHDLRKDLVRKILESQNHF